MTYGYPQILIDKRAYPLMTKNDRGVCLLLLIFCKDHKDNYERLLINYFLPAYLNKDTISKYSSCCSGS
jgi:hypothetical protein